MTNRSYLFSRYLDSAPFKDFTVLTEVKSDKLDKHDFWVNRQTHLPVVEYKKQKLKVDGKRIKGFYGVANVDKDEVTLKNNSSRPEIVTTIENTNLSIGDILYISYNTLDEKLVSHEKVSTSSVRTEDILPTSSNLTAFRDELVYYVCLTNEPYQSLLISLLKEVWEYYREVPGSRSGHHVYLGGLLEHVVEDIRIAKKIISLPNAEQSKLLGKVYTVSAQVHWVELEKRRRGEKVKTALHYMVNDFYKVADEYLALDGEISFDDVVLAYVVHDLGKVVETEYFNADPKRFDLLGMGNVDSYIDNDAVFFKLGKIGDAFGHSMLSSLILNNASKKVDIDYVFINRLIATHHFALHMGSIKPAKTKEEYLIHLCDKMGALFCAEQVY